MNYLLILKNIKMSSYKLLYLKKWYEYIVENVTNSIKI